MIAIESSNASAWGRLAPLAGNAAASAVPGGGAARAASAEPQISAQGRALSGLFEAASAFLQKEHLEPFTGWKYNSARYVLNENSAYLNVERYNDYLFGKAAGQLVEQAGQLGLALDKDEVVAQLKADNAQIAAIQFSNADRVKYLNMSQSVGYSYLSASEVERFTDMFILSKENGLDTDQLGALAGRKGYAAYNAASGNIFVENYFGPHSGATQAEVDAYEAKYFGLWQNKLDLGEEIRGKLANTPLGLDNEEAFFSLYLNKRVHLRSINEEELVFVSQILDVLAGRTPRAGTDVRTPGDDPGPGARAGMHPIDMRADQIGRGDAELYPDSPKKAVQDALGTALGAGSWKELRARHEAAFLEQLLAQFQVPPTRQEDLLETLARLGRSDGAPEGAGKVKEAS